MKSRIPAERHWEDRKGLKGSGQMAHTIKDVSLLSGVSTATVSRTFSNPESVREATRAKVMEAAKILDYQPNAIARSMARQTTEHVAFLICKHESSILDEFYAGICDGIMHVTKDADYRLLVSTADDWRNTRRNQVDGVILGGSATVGMISNYVRQNTKIVLVNHEISGFDFPRVVSDEEAGVRQAVEHLISRGHKKIAMLAGQFSPYICEARYNTFCAVMKEHGLTVPDRYVKICDPNIPDAERQAERMLIQQDPPTAVFGANDMIATGAMKAAIRLGRKIPEDIAIIGYDDSRVCEALEPELSSIHTDCTKMGELSAKLMLDLLAGKTPEKNRFVIEPKLVVRGST